MFTALDSLHAGVYRQICIFSCHSPAWALVSAHRQYTRLLVTRSKKHLSSPFLGAPGGIVVG